MKLQKVNSIPVFSMNEQEKIKSVLLQRLEETKSKNPAFSLRSFARMLKIAPSTLSMVISGQRNLSRSALQSLCERLMLDPTQTSEILDANKSLKPNNSRSNNLKGIVLSTDEFKVVSNWTHWAIMNALRIPRLQGQASAIAKEIGISTFEAQACLKRLQKLGIVRFTNDRWKLIQDKIQTSENIPNAAIRKLHADGLKQAESSLWNDDISRRDFATLFLSIQEKDLPEIQAETRKFLNKIQKFARKKNLDRVYRIQIQTFSLNKKGSKQ